MLSVTTASYVSEYKINLSFNNNESGVIDLESTIINDHRPIFNELKNIEKFRNFRVDMDTIVWDNGLDLAPEFLYEKMRSGQ